MTLARDGLHRLRMALLALATVPLVVGGAVAPALATATPAPTFHTDPAGPLSLINSPSMQLLAQLRTRPPVWPFLGATGFLGASILPESNDRAQRCSLQAALPGGSTDASALAVTAGTGVTLASANSSSELAPASTVKLLTATAVLSTFGSGARWQTKVVQGAKPGQIVLVGGGDPTLSADPRSLYRSGAKLVDLAKQVDRWSRASKQRITSIVLDDSLFGGVAAQSTAGSVAADRWPSFWPQSFRTMGDVAPVSALATDSGRVNPRSEYSTRSADPTLQTGRRFAALLGAGSAALSTGRAAAGAEIIGSVWGQTTGQLVGTMLRRSDNTIANTLAIHVAIARGVGNTLDRVQPALQRALRALSIDPSGLRALDASGLAAADRLPLRLLVDVLLRTDDQHSPSSGIIDALPVSRTSGTLRDRFTGASAIVGDHVQAKTGTLTGVSALAGLVTAKDGTRILFAIQVRGPSGVSRLRAEADAVAARMFTCGSGLTSR